MVCWSTLESRAKAVVATLRILDKVDKVTPEEMHGLLMGSGLSEQVATTLVALSQVSGSTTERLARSLELAGEHPKAVAGLKRLGEVLALVYEADPEAPVVFSPATARGLDYYTGIVYETFFACGVRRGQRHERREV